MHDDTITVDATPTRNDAWEWRAIYTDDTYLDEFDEHDGTQHGWKDIDLERLHSFVLFSKREHLQSHLLRLTPEARPIFFRRRSIELSIESGEDQGRTTTTVLGMQRTVRGVNVASYTYLFEDGSILVSDDFKAI
jgi:hypothetical protein